MTTDYRPLFAKHIPVTAERRVEMVTPERAAELIASNKGVLRAYVELGITSEAWVCCICADVHLNTATECHNCARWYFYERNLTRGERESVFRRWKHSCYYCGVNLTALASIDHQHARSRGGGHQPDNLVAACRSCNSQKGSRSPAEYRTYLEKLRGHSIIFWGESLLMKGGN